MQDNSFITKMTGRGELPIGKMPGFEPPDDETHEIILERFKKQMRKETVSTVFWTIMSLFFIITYIVMYFRRRKKGYPGGAGSFRCDCCSYYLQICVY